MLTASQQRWAECPLPARLSRLAALRRALARRPERLVRALGRSRPRAGEAELVSSELLPLLEACRFLEREAPRWLAPRRPGRRGQPFWLRGVELEIQREPLGVILVVGPGNYPLFLPGSHCLQALAAGNAVLWKPAPGCREVADEVARVWEETGGEPALLRVLAEDPAEAAGLVERGEVAKIVVTGSRATGEAVLRQAAARVIPVVAELSGCDVMWVGEGADLERAARALHFGLSLNEGRTCLAPRRVLVERPLWAAFRALAREQRPSAAAAGPWQAELDAARQAGASVLRERPWLLEFPSLPDPPLPAVLGSGVFGPLAALLPVDEREAALRWLDHSPCGLGASLFGEEKAMLALARQVRAGVVTINDLIAPTADPRLPFGGRRESGFGATRGGEGLLEMTAPRALQVRRGGWLPHLEPPRPLDGEVLTGYLQLTHGGGWSRLKGLSRLLGGILRSGRDKP